MPVPAPHAMMQECWEDKGDIPSRVGTRGKEEGAWLGREEEGDEVTPLALHPGTAICLHLHYESPASPTPRGLVPLGRIRTPRVAGSHPGRWEGVQNGRSRLEGAMGAQGGSARGHTAARPRRQQRPGPNPRPLVPFEGLSGWRSREDYGSGLTLICTQLERSRRKFGGGGPTLRASSGLGVRRPSFGHPGSPRTHRLGQQEAAFERAEEGARGQQGAEPGHCPATSGAVRGLRIGLRICVGGPHSGALCRARASLPHPMSWREAETRCAEGEKVELN